MNTTNNNNYGNFWENLGLIARNILAHINITFDGATGSVHIDVLPTSVREVILEQEDSIPRQNEQKE